MNRLSRWILLMLLLALPGAACALELTVKDNGGRFTVPAGETITIVLAGNPTTGYGWEVTAVDRSILAPDPEPAFVPDSTLTGSGGRFTFRMYPVSCGTSRLELQYRRAWEKKIPPLETFSVQFVVGPPDPAIVAVTYVGAGGAELSASFDREGKQVRLVLPGRATLLLPEAAAASGARYSDGSRTFWEHQGKATFSEGETIVFEGSVKAGSVVAGSHGMVNEWYETGYLARLEATRSPCSAVKGSSVPRIIVRVEGKYLRADLEYRFHEELSVRLGMSEEKGGSVVVRSEPGREGDSPLIEKLIWKGGAAPSLKLVHEQGKRKQVVVCKRVPQINTAPLFGQVCPRARKRGRGRLVGFVLPA